MKRWTASFVLLFLHFFGGLCLSLYLKFPPRKALWSIITVCIVLSFDDDRNPLKVILLTFSWSLYLMSTFYSRIAHAQSVCDTDCCSSLIAPSSDTGRCWFWRCPQLCDQNFSFRKSLRFLYWCLFIFPSLRV